MTDVYKRQDHGGGGFAGKGRAQGKREGEGHNQVHDVMFAQPEGGHHGEGDQQGKDAARPARIGPRVPEEQQRPGHVQRGNRIPRRQRQHHAGGGGKIAECGENREGGEGELRSGGRKQIDGDAAHGTQGQELYQHSVHAQAPLKQIGERRCHGQHDVGQKRGVAQRRGSGQQASHPEADLSAEGLIEAEESGIECCGMEAHHRAQEHSRDGHANRKRGGQDERARVAD